MELAKKARARRTFFTEAVIFIVHVKSFNGGHRARKLRDRHRAS